MKTPRQVAAIVASTKKRRKAAQEHKSFAALRAAPAALGSAAAGGSLQAFKLPANARLALSVNAPTVTGQVTAAINGHTLGIMGGKAGAVQPLGLWERGQELVIKRAAGGPAGTVTLYVLDDWSRPSPIATGTFT
jgi:hypothetical protein